MLKIYQKKDSKSVAAQVQETALEQKYDVIVAGLGSAGSMAAIQAAKCGMKVLGLEFENFMGGQSTGGGVFIYYLGSSGGLFENVDERVKELEQEGFITVKEECAATGRNPDVKKYVLEQMALQEGVHIVYEAPVIGVLVDGKRAVGVQWISNGKVHYTLADVVIDATAEGYLFEMMDCKMCLGRDARPRYQPFSNVIMTMQNDSIHCNYNDCGYMDPYDMENISKEVVKSNNYPLYNRRKYAKEERIITFSRLIGCREGKRIYGKKQIRLKELLSGTREGHVLFYGYANIDVHGKDMAFESELFQYWTVVCGLWGIRLRIPVPAETCVMEEYEGILAAGRHIASDHDVASALRMNRDMYKCGEAVGTLAACMVNHGHMGDSVFQEAEKILIESGCVKTEEVEMHAAFFDENDEEQFLISDLEKIQESLAGEKAGWGIWSAFQMDEEQIIPALLQWIEEEQYCANSALALGMKGRKEAAPVLRRIAAGRDMTFFSNSTMYNQPRCIAAIYLLGKLGDTGSISYLENILHTPDFCKDIEITGNEFIEDHDDLYFQFYSYAMVALLWIGQMNEGRRTEIRKSIKESLEKTDIRVCINLKGGNLLKLDMKAYLRKNAETYMAKWEI